MPDALDVARAFYRALNAADLDAMIALYHPDCVVEHVWMEGGDVVEGRDRVRGRWADELTRYHGALPGGHRMDVTRIAGIETEWGWVRAEWVRAAKPASGGGEQGAVGYSHFWVEDGLIRRHRTIAEAVSVARSAVPRPPSERRYPTKPLVGVGGVILSDAGEVLIVKRGQEPLAGQWSLPGGMLEIGETLEAGVAREMLEETGLVVSVGPVVEVFDRILLDDTGQVRYHFVLIDYLCHVRGGVLQAGSDVEAAEFVNPQAVAAYRLTEKAQDVIAAALRMCAGAPGRGVPDRVLIQSSSMPDALISRDRAWALVTEHVQSESLRKHLLGVEAAVRGYARLWGEDEEGWGFVALIHDFDFEKYPDRENHPFRGVEILKGLGYPDWVTRAVLSHADYSGVPRESRLERTLFACDEMSGFVVAASLVRPSRSVLDLEASSVIKRMKDKAFARAVPREDLRKGAEELGLPLDQHITNVIGFLRVRADELGIRGTL